MSFNEAILHDFVTLCDPAVNHGYGRKVYQKSYRIDGPSGSRQWLQIGVLAMLGEYRLHPGWQLSEDDYIKPFLGGAGLQCVADHVHHAYWRILGLGCAAGQRRGGLPHTVRADLTLALLLGVFPHWRAGSVGPCSLLR
jgi:hypothetical protein